MIAADMTRAGMAPPSPSFPQVKEVYAAPIRQDGPFRDLTPKGDLLLGDDRLGTL
jgi:hypothetical protein